MTAPPMSRAEQALLLADTARRRRLTPDEAALLRRRITELANRTGGESGETGPVCPDTRTSPRQPRSRTHSPHT